MITSFIIHYPEPEKTARQIVGLEFSTEQTRAFKRAPKGFAESRSLAEQQSDYLWPRIFFICSKLARSLGSMSVTAAAPSPRTNTILLASNDSHVPAMSPEDEAAGTPWGVGGRSTLRAFFVPSARIRVSISPLSEDRKR